MKSKQTNKQTNQTNNGKTAKQKQTYQALNLIITHFTWYFSVAASSIDYLASCEGHTYVWKAADVFI